MTRRSLNNNSDHSGKHTFGDLRVAKLLSDHTLKKAERLKSQLVISRLFQEGRQLSKYPFKIIWLTEELNTPYPAQICISVPKKTIPKPGQRNRIKRLCREAYRKNKHILYKHLIDSGKQLAFVLMWLERAGAGEYSLVEEQLQKSLEGLLKELQTSPGSGKK